MNYVLAGMSFMNTQRKCESHLCCLPANICASAEMYHLRMGGNEPDIMEVK